MKAIWLLAFGLLAASAHAQTLLTEPMLQTCPRATAGAPTTPWVSCTGGIRFASIADALVATGDFNQGTWQNFGAVSGETMVAVCPAGALLETEARCRTADGSTWATKFARKDTLPAQATWRITFRWDAVTQYDDSTSITLPVSYVLTWYGTDATGVPNTPNTDAETIGAPLVVTAPQQRICARLRAKAGGVLSEPSQEVCIAPRERKPGIPANVTVEFGSP